MCPAGETIDHKKPVYVSRIKVAHESATDRSATLPPHGTVVAFGEHTDLSSFFGTPHGTFIPKPSTLDYVVAAAAACLTSTFGILLSIRGISVDQGKLQAEATGNFSPDQDGILVLDGMHVHFLVATGEPHRNTVSRVHQLLRKQGCSVTRTLAGVTVASDFELIAL